MRHCLIKLLLMLQYKNLPLATSQAQILLLLILYIYVVVPIPSFLPNLLKEICQIYVLCAAKSTHN